FAGRHPFGDSVHNNRPGRSPAANSLTGVTCNGYRHVHRNRIGFGTDVLQRLSIRFVMYKTFFNLQRNPFEITPDPAFMFPTQRHNEALAALYYGVQRRKGFVVMTGEVGTGKTLVVRCLLELLNRQSVTYAYVFNSRLC